MAGWDISCKWSFIAGKNHRTNGQISIAMFDNWRLCCCKSCAPELWSIDRLDCIAKNLERGSLRPNFGASGNTWPPLVHSCRDRQANLTDWSMVYLLVIPLFTMVHNYLKSYQLVYSYRCWLSWHSNFNVWRLGALTSDLRQMAATFWVGNGSFLPLYLPSFAPQTSLWCWGQAWYWQYLITHRSYC